MSHFTIFNVGRAKRVRFTFNGKYRNYLVGFHGVIWINGKSRLEGDYVLLN